MGCSSVLCRALVIPAGAVLVLVYVWLSLRVGKHENTLEQVVQADRFNIYYLHSPKPCTDEQLVISIHSAVTNIEKRKLLRSTWLNRSLLSNSLPVRIKIVFILGGTVSPSVQQYVDYEVETFDDILQCSFIDNYRNNTYKALCHLRWVSGFSGCANASVILKFDDDVIVNLSRMKHVYKLLEDAIAKYGDNFMMGNVFGGGPNRNPRNQWYVSKAVYPDDKYPPWFQGMVYMLTPALAAKMYNVSANTTYMHTDDVYVSLLADRVRPPVHRISVNQLYAPVYMTEKNQTLFWLKSEKIFFHCFKPQTFMSLWQLSCNDWHPC